MSSHKRILLGTTEICRHLYDFADAFRQLGHTAHTIVACRHPQHPDLRYTYSLTGVPLFRPFRFWNAINLTYNLVRWPYLLNAYDIYVFQYGSSLLPDNDDYALLRQRGKKIVCLFNGSDIRHWSAAEPVRKSFGLKTYPVFRDKGGPLCSSLRKLRMAERYADAIFFQPSYGELAVRPYMHFYLPVNLALYRWCVPARDVPVVVHAPSRAEAKGTTEIFATLERLKAEGVVFELRLLQGVPNKEVIQQLIDADVVVDELNEANYGMLALEAMATGCAVAGGNHPGLVPLPPNRPVLHIDPTNVHSQLRRLLTDKTLRLRLACEGRPYVEEYHDHLKVAKNMLQCLEPSINRTCDYYPDFFAQDYSLPNGESIGDDLKHMTTEIVQDWGLPPDVEPKDMVARGLLSNNALAWSNRISRWAFDPL